MAINMRKLIVESYRDIRGDNAIKTIDPGLLGCVIASVWVAEVAADKFPADKLSKLVKSDSDVPETVRNSLHIRRRVDGDYLEEATEMLVAAQSAGFFGRLNPTNVSPFFKVNAATASQMLKAYQVDHPDEVAWARRAIEQFQEKEIAEKAAAKAKKRSGKARSNGTSRLRVKTA